VTADAHATGTSIAIVRIACTRCGLKTVNSQLVPEANLSLASTYAITLNLTIIFTLILVLILSLTITLTLTLTSSNALTTGRVDCHPLNASKMLVAFLCL